MMQSTAKPSNFDNYWETVDVELARYETRPELTALPLRSNQHSTVYALRLTSIGPTRLYGYFTVPTGDGGPYPALMQTPFYGSVNHIPDYNDRQRYVCLVVMHRGQRLADKPWAATYPGLLTEGFNSPEEFIYRAIVADCLRGAEFLFSRREVDRDRIAISGDHLAMITAARRLGFTDLVTGGGFMYRLMEARQNGRDYPIEELNDYLRSTPDEVSAVGQTLALFDPVHHVGDYRGQTLFTLSGDRAWHQPLLDNFGGEVDVYESVQESGTDADALDANLAKRFDVPTMSRFITEFESRDTD